LLGVFHRAFPVQLPREPIRFMTAEIKNVTDIDHLMYQKWVSKSESSVFTFGGQAFGYGNGMEDFANAGFYETQLTLRDSPQLAEGLIIEGLVDDARMQGRHYFGIFRNCCKMIADSSSFFVNGFKVRAGYDLTAVHWDHGDETTFGLIIGPAWIVERTMVHDIPYGGFPEIESRLLEIHGVDRSDGYVGSFVDSHNEFALPCGGRAVISREPLTVFTESMK